MIDDKSDVPVDDAGSYDTGFRVWPDRFEDECLSVGVEGEGITDKGTT